MKHFFHFTNDISLRDGSPIPPVGEWLIYPGKPIICQRGFHNVRNDESF